MPWMVRFSAALLILLASCSAPSPVPAPRPVETVKIGALFPMTRAHSQMRDITLGIEVALAECKSQAGGFEIKLEIKDHDLAVGGWNAEIRRAEELIQELCKDPDVVAVIGPFTSGMARMAIPPMNEAHLVLVSPTASRISLTRGGFEQSLQLTGPVNFARMAPRDDIQGEVAADWAKKSGVRRVIVLDDGREEYGTAIATSFVKRAGEIGLEVILHRTVPGEGQDLKPLVDEIKSGQPDLVFCGGTTQTSQSIAWALLGVEACPRVLFPDGCLEKEFLALIGKNPDGRCFFIQPGIPREKMWERYPEFSDPFKPSRGRSPLAVYAYEAARVVIDAIRRAGRKDREAIRAAVLATRDFESALGRWSFDAHGDTTLRTAGIYGLRNGEFELVEMME